MFDLSACSVEPEAPDHYCIRWQPRRPGQRVAVYMSDDPERYYRNEEPGIPLLYSTDTEIRLRNPEPGVRHYFYLQSDEGDGVILAERKLSLQGTPNFRDLGGYETLDGSRLRWGKLFRSGKLSGLSHTDIDYVKRLGVSLICDFRQVIEQELEPTLLGEDGQHQFASLPISPGSSSNFMENLHRGIIQMNDAAGFMQAMNRDLAANQMPQYAEMFRLLLTGDQPLLIHCASGKDRTGVGAALILDVLGVDEEVIVQDYLLTNRYLPVDEEVERLSREMVDQTGSPVSEDILRPLLELRPEYIQACFEEIRKRYNSRQHFFETALDLDPHKIATLKERYLH